MMNIVLTTEDKEAIDVIRNSVRVIMVFEPRFGSRFLPKYFGKLKHFDNVDHGILYC